MNEKIDLTKILKNCPKGWKFYSSAFGEVEFDSMSEYNINPICIRVNANFYPLLNKYGKYHIENKGECIPLIAPLDVRLDSDDKTMVQPDVAILCDKNKIRKWGIDGAPDFIIEVLSPSTRSKDSIKKLGKYLDAGVREYWMIDPDKRKVIVYDFEHEDYPAIYGLEEKIPVRMYEGRLQIDANMIREMIREYPDSPED